MVIVTSQSEDIANAPINEPLICIQEIPEECSKGSQYIILYKHSNGTWTCSDEDCEHDPPISFAQFVSEKINPNTFLDIV